MVTKQGRLAAVFAALGDETRRAILEMLSAGSRPVNEIAETFPVSRPAISKHLRILREAGLVEENKEGRQRIYELVGEPLEGVASWLDDCRRGAGMAARPAPESSPPAERTKAIEKVRGEPRRAPAPTPSAPESWKVW